MTKRWNVSKLQFWQLILPYKHDFWKEEAKNAWRKIVRFFQKSLKKGGRQFFDSNCIQTDNVSILTRKETLLQSGVVFIYLYISVCCVVCGGPNLAPKQSHYDFACSRLLNHERDNPLRFNQLRKSSLCLCVVLRFF